MSLLAEHAKNLFNLDLSDGQIEQFGRLTAELIDWNQRVNLTAITDPKDIMVKHILDSLSLARVILQFDGKKLIDVGTGAGFPGLVLAILYPDLHVTLMEATRKKLTFIEHIGETLGLSNIATLHARAEDAGQMPEHREKYDLVTARAVARMAALMEYLLPLAALEGQVVAMKGESAYQESNQAAKAIEILGGELFGIEAVKLPDIDDNHYLVVVDKIEPTPQDYPRKAGIPTRNPIS